MSRVHFTLLALAATALLALTALACAPARTIVTERTIEQVALVPAPSGPHAVGPPLRENGVGLEGAFSFNQVHAGTSREEGESGHIVVQTSGRGRVALGLSDFAEVGFSGEYHGIGLATPIASDTTSKDLIDDDVWRFGTQLRIHGGDERFRIGGLLELEMAEVPFARTVTETRTEYIYDNPDPDPDNPASTPRDAEPSDIIRYPTHSETETFNVLMPYARLGFFATSWLAQNLSVTAGGLVQNQPIFFGSERHDGVCFYDQGDIRTDDCDGTRRASDVDYFENFAVFTVFGAVALDLEPFTLIAHFYGHLAGDPRTVGASPGGGELVVRWSM